MDYWQLRLLPEWQRKYTEYISSPEWRRKRQEVLDRDGHCCQTCLETESLEVHHKKYPRDPDEFGGEPLEDLITLCKQCHEVITDSIRRRRYEGRELEGTDTERLTPTYRTPEQPRVQIEHTELERAAPRRKSPTRQRKQIEHTDVERLTPTRRSPQGDEGTDTAPNNGMS